MNDPVRIAQIGVGYWGPNLLRNLVANRHIHVSAVADMSADRRDFVTGLYPGIAVTDHADTVISNPEIDALVIATPADTHHSLALQALQAGKHVLVEKPMALSVDEIDEIKAAADAKNLVAMVGHTFLFNTAVHYLRDIVASGELGDIRYIYAQRLNLGRIRSDVDALWNLAPHDVSIIQFLLGDPEPLSITRRGMDFIQDGIDDVVFLQIAYPGKIMAHVHVSWLDPHKVRKVTVVGSKKMAVYDDIAEHKIAVYDKGIDQVAVLGEQMDYDRGPLEFTHRSGGVIMPDIRRKEPLSLEVQHFIDCIRGAESCRTGPDHARGVIRILSENSPA